MTWWTWILVALSALVIVGTVLAVSVRRSREALIELAKLVPVCIVLLRDLLTDPAVPRRAKIAAKKAWASPTRSATSSPSQRRRWAR